jgi:hypothetical protein
VWKCVFRSSTRSSGLPRAAVITSASPAAGRGHPAARRRAGSPTAR